MSRTVSVTILIPSSALLALRLMAAFRGRSVSSEVSAAVMTELSRSRSEVSRLLSPDFSRAVSDAEAESCVTFRKHAPAKRGRAELFLRSLLAGGSMDNLEVKLEAKAAGISLHTLQRAKRESGVRSVQLQPGKGPWHWVLPDPSPGPTDDSPTTQVDS